MVFKDTLHIEGKHGYILKKYTKDRSADNAVSYKLKDVEGNSNEVTVFDTIFQAFMVSAMLGLIENRSAKTDKSGTELATATIMSDIFVNRTNRLLIDKIVQFVCLLNAENSIDLKIKKAFKATREKEEEKELESMILDYVRGGSEILEEYLGQATTYEDFVDALDNLVQDFSLDIKDD